MIVRITHDTRMLTHECGTGARSFGGDGDPADGPTVKLDLPSSTVFDQLGRMYISDQQNQRVRRVDEDGIIRTIVGTGTPGFGGDGGPATAAMLRARGSGQGAPPSSRMAIDAVGNLFIADTGNNLVRKVDTSGIIRTVAGDTTGAGLLNWGFSGDGGPATSAKLNAPTDIEFGPDGLLYIADTRNHCVRVVDENGIITTVVGKGGNPGYDGEDKAPLESRLNSPYGIAFSPDGKLYIADLGNNRIRYVEVLP
jgi:DNA-binding beta-propeller fold protein YncE